MCYMRKDLFGEGGKFRLELLISSGYDQSALLMKDAKVPLPVEKKIIIVFKKGVRRKS